MKLKMLETQSTKRQNPLEFLADLRARVREPFWGHENLGDFYQHSFSDGGDNRPDRQLLEESTGTTSVLRRTIGQIYNQDV